MTALQEALTAAAPEGTALRRSLSGWGIFLPSLYPHTARRLAHSKCLIKV